MKYKKYKIGYQRNPKLTNQFAPGGFLNTLNKWGESIFGEDDSFSGKGLNSGGMSLANLGASLAGSIGNSLINKDGLSTGAGDIMSTVGQAASAIPGVGGLIGAGVNVLGGLTNKAFGSKINQEFVDNTEMGIKQLGNTQYMGNTSDSLMDEFQSTNFMNDVSRKQVGKDGWFANKAKKKANRLNKQIGEAEGRALNNFGLSTSNLATNNMLTGMSNYFADGGSLGAQPQRDKFNLPINKQDQLLLTGNDGLSDNSYSRPLDPILEALRNHNKEKKPYELQVNKYSKGGPKNKRSYGGNIVRGITDLDTGMTIPELNPRIKLLEKGGNLNNNYETTNHNMRKNIFNNGGILSSLESGFGSDFSNGLKHINAGGKHEQNPNEGVLMGFDQKGIPNLVEEGEVIYNDYVFSNRIEPTEEDLLIYKLPDSFLGKTYAEIAKKLSEESQERPNDPISERGLSASMSKLVQAQENTKYKMDTKANAEEIDALSLEDLNIYASALGGQEEEQMQQSQEQEQQMQQDIIQEELGVDPNMISEEVGPNLFAKGGPQNSYNKALGSFQGWVGDNLNSFQSWIQGGKNKINSIFGQSNTNKITPITGEYTDLEAVNRSQPIQGTLRQSDIDRYDRIPHKPNPVLGQGNRIESGVSPINRNTSTVSNRNTIDSYGTLGTNSSNKNSLQEEFKRKEIILPDLPDNPYGYLTGEEANKLVKGRIDNTKRIDPLQFGNSDDDETKGKGSILANLRYAPVIDSGISVLSDILGKTNKPDYTAADAILDSTSNLRKVSAPKIGDYMSYNPFDTDYYVNQLDAANSGVRRAIQNTSGGNRASAQASLLAVDHNANMQRGALARQSAESNLQQRQIVSDFNRNTNMQNAQMDLQAQMANQNVDQIKMNAQIQRAQLRDAANARADEARAFNLSNFFNNLGAVGKEEYSRNAIMNNPALSYSLDRLGNTIYKNQNTNKKKTKK